MDIQGFRSKNRRTTQKKLYPPNKIVPPQRQKVPPPEKNFQFFYSKMLYTLTVFVCFFRVLAAQRCQIHCFSLNKAPQAKILRYISKIPLFLLFFNTFRRLRRRKFYLRKKVPPPPAGGGGGTKKSTPQKKLYPPVPLQSKNVPPQMEGYIERTPKVGVPEALIYKPPSPHGRAKFSKSPPTPRTKKKKFLGSFS